MTFKLCKHTKSTLEYLQYETLYCLPFTSENVSPNKQTNYEKLHISKPDLDRKAGASTVLDYRSVLSAKAERSLRPALASGPRVQPTSAQTPRRQGGCSEARGARAVGAEWFKCKTSRLFLLATALHGHMLRDTPVQGLFLCLS